MDIVQLIEKAIGYALYDAYYLLPVIGSIQIFLTQLLLLFEWLKSAPNFFQS